MLNCQQGGLRSTHLSAFRCLSWPYVLPDVLGVYQTWQETRPLRTGWRCSNAATTYRSLSPSHKPLCKGRKVRAWTGDTVSQAKDYQDAP